jgi:hypothetical protein
MHLNNTITRLTSEVSFFRTKLKNAEKILAEILKVAMMFKVPVQQ